MQALFNTEVFAFSPASASNYTSVTKGLSETNKMPGHGRNVHNNDLNETCDYYSFENTFAKLNKAHFTHSPYARYTTLRFRNLAFERSATMATDIQCVLYALVGTEPVVRNVRLAQPGKPYIEADIITSKHKLIVEKVNESVIVMDRHGFHIARGTVSTEVSTRPPRRGARASKEHVTISNTSEVEHVLNYCKAVRQLPQKERHFKLDGLPCVPVRVEDVVESEAAY